MPVPADERQSGGDRRSEGEGDDPDERRPRAVHGAILPRRYRPRCATISLVADNIFEDPRLAQVYDPLDPDRSDLDVYVAMVAELGARSVLDVGCGTGTFACMLARRGVDVIAVDPAAASLDVARSKPGAEAVRWLHGDATTLPPLAVDAAFMTGNVAQVFLTDDDWTATLRGIWFTLRPGGWLVFETARPRRAGHGSSGRRS